MTPLAAIWEIDLHGKSVYQARVAIDSALRSINPGCTDLILRE